MICRSVLPLRRIAKHTLAAGIRAERPPAASSRRALRRRRSALGGKCGLRPKVSRGRGERIRRCTTTASSARWWRRRHHQPTRSGRSRDVARGRHLRRGVILRRRQRRTHHLGEHDAHPLDERQQYSSDYRRARHGLWSGAGREDAARGGAGADGVPRILLLPYRRQRTIAAREQSSPHRELSPQYRPSRRHGAHGAVNPRSLGSVPRPLDGVKYASADRSHAERSADVVDDAPRTRFPVGDVVPGHFYCCLGLLPSPPEGLLLDSADSGL
mmetsp:Transcript_28196/g.52490  ORF Transcript_28196/g.52490 Transcript_28196/m.52490 type:complete len:271 (-) Transcript_28196:80-892(-)